MATNMTNTSEEKEEYRILAINVGSTSTKIAVFANENCVVKKTINYTTETLSKFMDSMEQLDMRIQDVETALTEEGIPLNSFDIVVSRGGRLPSHNTGAYEVNDIMIHYLRNVKNALHPASSGAFIAQYFADNSHCKAIIYDGPRSDELYPEAHVTGLSGIYRLTGVHVLNGRACCIRYAESVGKRMDELNLIVIHLGGGISLTAFEKGRMVDALNDMESALSPERVGPITSEQVLDYYDTSEYTLKEMVKKIRGKGGMVDLLGTNDVREVERRIAAGDQKAAIVHKAMCYQSAKGIGSMAAALRFHVDGVIITGSIARSELAVNTIRGYIDALAPVAVYPGEFEMEALAGGALRVLLGKEEAQCFSKELSEYQFSI